jgi:hypothetical protein
MGFDTWFLECLLKTWEFADRRILVLALLVEPRLPRLAKTCDKGGKVKECIKSFKGEPTDKSYLQAQGSAGIAKLLKYIVTIGGE